MGEKLTTGEIRTRSVPSAFRRTVLDGAARLMRENHVVCLVVVDDQPDKRTVIAVVNAARAAGMAHKVARLSPLICVKA
jgi:CBS-domain-containing membrane protein